MHSKMMFKTFGTVSTLKLRKLAVYVITQRILVSFLYHSSNQAIKAFHCGSYPLESVESLITGVCMILMIIYVKSSTNISFWI